MVTGVFQLPENFPSTSVGESHPWYVASEENWMVHEVVRCLTTNPRESETSRFSPIIIWGPTGVGKSLLLSILSQSLAELKAGDGAHSDLGAYSKSTALSFQTKLTMRLVPAADWIRSSLTPENCLNQKHEPESLRPSTRLLIDDIHQLSGYEGAQQRLADFLDRLHEQDGVAILSSQRFPLDRHSFIPRLTSRLLAGTTLELSFPGPSARSIIIGRVARQLGWMLDEEAVQAASRYLPLNVRLLHGRLSQLLPMRPLRQQPLTANEFEMRLSHQHKSNTLSAGDIINAVAKRFQLSARFIRSTSRRQNVVQARSVAMYLIRLLTALPLKEIGRSFTNRDHSTVLHSIQKIEQALSEDMSLKRLIDELQVTLQPIQ